MWSAGDLPEGRSRTDDSSRPIPTAAIWSALRPRAFGFGFSLPGATLLFTGLVFSKLDFFEGVFFVAVFIDSILFGLAIIDSIWTIGSLIPI